MRAREGPALSAFGFRPFFLGSVVRAALAMTLRIGMLTGDAPLLTAFGPVS